MFKNVGKRRIVKYILTPPLTTHTLLKEESQELVKQHEEHTQNLLLLAQLSKERRSLLDWIEQPPTPLIDRIDYQPTFLPPALPHLHFHQNKKLLRIKKYNEILEPTLNRISPFFIKISKTRIWAENSQYDPLWEWFNRLQDITLELDEVEYKLTLKEWRLLKSACKHLKKVDFSYPATRVPEYPLNR